MIQTQQHTQSQNQSCEVALLFLRIRKIFGSVSLPVSIPTLTFRSWSRSREAVLSSAAVGSFVALQGTAAFSDGEAPCGSVTGA